MSPLTLIPCPHVDVRVIRSVGTTRTGEETTYGVCRGCDAWVVTDLAPGTDRLVTRAMTPLERQRCEAFEAEIAREEADAFDAIGATQPEQLLGEHRAAEQRVIDESTRFEINAKGRRALAEPPDPDDPDVLHFARTVL